MKQIVYYNVIFQSNFNVYNENSVKKMYVGLCMRVCMYVSVYMAIYNSALQEPHEGVKHSTVATQQI